MARKLSERENYDRLAEHMAELRQIGEAWQVALDDLLRGAIVGAPAVPEGYDG